jgi:hypothetical protein
MTGVTWGRKALAYTLTAILVLFGIGIVMALLAAVFVPRDGTVTTDCNSSYTYCTTTVR